MNARILVVDDDAALSEMIGIVLTAEGFEPVFCYDGATAVDTFRAVRPDLLLLDLMLPGKDGIQVCREIRTISDVPVVMLTAKSDTVDVVRGLERANSQELRIGDLTIDVSGHSVHRGDHEIGLTPLEFDLLTALARAPHQVFSREMLLRDVWGYQHAADTRLVNVHVQRLRSKIERDPESPEIVVTVRGVGYKAGTSAR
jgi:two-component system response regulator MtrA